MSVYKLFGAGTGGTESGVAQIDIQFPGVITAIHGALSCVLDGAGEECAVEVSFLSVSTISTNDTRGSLFTMKNKIGTGTASVNSAKNSGIGGLAISVGAGERVWMHYVATAGVVATAEIYLYVEDGEGAQTPQRRR